MIARAFMVTIAIASMLSIVSQAMHLDEEKGSKVGVTVPFWSLVIYVKKEYDN